MECIHSIEWLWPAYWFGVLVYGMTLATAVEVEDIVASFVVGFLWPVALPVRILKRILR